MTMQKPAQDLKPEKRTLKSHGIWGYGNLKNGYFSDSGSAGVAIHTPAAVYKRLYPPLKKGQFIYFVIKLGGKGAGLGVRLSHRA